MKIPWSFRPKRRSRTTYVIRLDELVRQLKIQSGTPFRLDEIIMIASLRTKRSDSVVIYFIKNSKGIDEAIVCLDPNLKELKSLMDAKVTRGNSPKYLFGAGFAPRELVERVIKAQKAQIAQIQIPS